MSKKSQYSINTQDYPAVSSSVSTKLPKEVTKIVNKNSFRKLVINLLSVV